MFEYVDHTLLNDLERCPTGIPPQTVRLYLWQVISAIEFCHSHNVIHRDVKPENILISAKQVVKLCDFGFARSIAGPGELYTDYVATRWYRSPELLVGDPNYGKPVDIWAVGCLLSEMLTGEPLFPGDSDIDQLHHIVSCLGNVTSKHAHVFLKNSLFHGVRIPESKNPATLQVRLFFTWSTVGVFPPKESCSISFYSIYTTIDTASCQRSGPIVHRADHGMLVNGRRREVRLYNN